MKNSTASDLFTARNVDARSVSGLYVFITEKKKTEIL